MPAPRHSIFYRPLARCPSWRPTNSVKTLKANSQKLINKVQSNVDEILTDQKAKENLLSLHGEDVNKSKETKAARNDMRCNSMLQHQWDDKHSQVIDVDRFNYFTISMQWNNYSQRQQGTDSIISWQKQQWWTFPQILAPGCSFSAASTCPETTLRTYVKSTRFLPFLSKHTRYIIRSHHHGWVSEWAVS